MKQIVVFLFAALTSLTTMSCDSETTSAGNNDPNVFTISGTLQNPKAITVPPSAKLYGVWSISSGSPDYTYIYGSGTVNTSANTFTFRLSTPPPAVALNANELGIAYLILIDADLPEGKIDEDLDDSLEAQGKFYGAINDRAIVFVNGSPDTANYGRSWVKDFNFKSGYNFGKGWYNPGSGFDGFTPDSGAIVLLIEKDPSVYTFPNWTRIKHGDSNPD
jgi:hypothetical protein